jgi:hypothetical protein
MNIIQISLRTSILVSVALTSLIIDTGVARSQQRACVITDDGATVCGKLTTAKKVTQKPTQNSGFRKEVNNFVFLLKGCTKVDTTVKCNLLITNKGAERNLGIDAAGLSTIVDSVGKSYPGSTVDIGGVSSSFRVITAISPGIDYVAVITFENVPERMIQAPLVNFVFGSKVQFRNVAFSN